jgi:hypothetical protein
MVGRRFPLAKAANQMCLLLLGMLFLLQCDRGISGQHFGSLYCMCFRASHMLTSRGQEGYQQRLSVGVWGGALSLHALARSALLLRIAALSVTLVLLFCRRRLLWEARGCTLGGRHHPRMTRTMSPQTGPPAPVTDLQSALQRVEASAC